MNNILRPFLDKFILVYLDDIIIFSESPKEHEEHLRLVLNALREHSLYARPSKCLFSQSSLDFCGYLVRNREVRPLQSKVDAVAKWPIPINVHEVQAFLGLVSFYRRFIRRFALITVPLFNLLHESNAEIRKKKFRKIVWSAQTEAAFQELKGRLCSEPVLKQPDTTRPFITGTDASDDAVDMELL